MKKKITRPDGTVEDIEGTPKEIAEYERGLTGSRKVESKKKGKRILNEERVSEIVEEALGKHRNENHIYVRPYDSRPWYPYRTRPYWETPWWDYTWCNTGNGISLHDGHELEYKLPEDNGLKYSLPMTLTSDTIKTGVGYSSDCIYQKEVNV